MPLRAAIIGVLSASLVLLAGCSTVKLGYGQGGFLAYRWLDGYVDFDAAQAPRVRAALDELLAWHRRSQLGDYAATLAKVGVELPADVTPERVCAVFGDVRSRVDVALERALPAIAEIAPTLSARQIAHIEKRFAEKNADYREDFLQRDLGKRRKAAVKRELERVESVYGSIDVAQRELIAHGVASSLFDADVAYAERLLRQQETLALLRRLAAERPVRDEAVVQIRHHLERLEKSPREAYRRYSERLHEANCAHASAVHNAMQPTQRRHAIAKLKGYESDLRELAAEASG